MEARSSDNLRHSNAAQPVLQPICSAGAAQTAEPHRLHWVATSKMGYGPEHDTRGYPVEVRDSEAAYHETDAKRL